ncbi:D-alanine--D-alanine ligase [Candidatus Gracilibacteria bacterium]|nr:D-alanine--D-alanine ligase [Candidatus Gracilibacteria bacterium]
MATKSKVLTVAVVFGGKSQEHESSVASGSKVIEELQSAKNKKKYNVVAVGVSRDGQWFTGDAKVMVAALMSGKVKNAKGLTPCSFAADGSGELLVFTKKGASTSVKRIKINVAFSWILGPLGEDGALQGVFEAANIPYVGCGIFASAAGFNKILTKRVLEASGIPQVPYEWFTDADWKHNKKEIVKCIQDDIGFPAFVKPASCGSSIGISKVKKLADLDKAVKAAMVYDHQVVVERGVQNLYEVECAVIGDDDDLVVSEPGQVHYTGEFYDYKAKYLASDWAIDIPAKLPKEVIEHIKALAEATFRAIDGVGGARIDFLVDGKTWEIYLNELNTIPNFRPISCYPVLLKHAGWSYGKIIDRFIALALKHHKRKNAKKLDFKSGSSWFKE